MITVLQLRAARACLKTSCRQLSELTGVGFRTITHMENGPALGVPNSLLKNVLSLKNFFEAKGIIFSQDGFGISIDKEKFSKALEESGENISGAENSDTAAA